MFSHYIKHARLDDGWQRGRNAPAPINILARISAVTRISIRSFHTPQNISLDGVVLRLHGTQLLLIGRVTNILVDDVALSPIYLAKVQVRGARQAVSIGPTMRHLFWPELGDRPR